MVAFSVKITLLQISAESTNINLVEVYAPTEDKIDIEDEQDMEARIMQESRQLHQQHDTINLSESRKKYRFTISEI